ncbi:hypothetical protein, partial [Azospirillum thiophilum]|uniref:hypothetical protein n=1 Tax=Azospirillum thiophilum TaxID=528244 RepID=UPI0005EE9062
MTIAPSRGPVAWKKVTLLSASGANDLADVGAADGRLTHEMGCALLDDIAPGAETRREEQTGVA